MTKFNLDKLREIAKPRELSRAEEMALKAYPRDEDRELNFRRTNYRIAYERGYKQAEKDLALTIQDIELLHTFLYAVKNNKHGVFTFTRLTDEQYAEVLKRYKEVKQ